MYKYHIKDKDHMYIQSISSHDVARVVELERLCFPVPWSEESIRIEIEENRFARYLVVKYKKEIIGYGGVWLIVGEAHITNIAIHPDYRRRGIGRELMLSLMETAIDFGISNMTLEVRMSNMAAQALYRQLNFEKYGIREGYYADTNEDAIIMWNSDIKSTVRKYRGNGCGA